MRTGLRHRVPAPVLFVFGALSMYAGAALAVGLFGRLAPASVAVLRILGAAAVLLAVAPTRPRRPGGGPARCAPSRSAWRRRG